MGTERRVGNVQVRVREDDDWVIGMLFIDDETSVFRASLDSRKRSTQIEIKGRGYSALLRQAEHVIGLHAGLVEVVSGHRFLSEATGRHRS